MEYRLTRADGAPSTGSVMRVAVQSRVLAVCTCGVWHLIAAQCSTATQEKKRKEMEAKRKADEEAKKIQDAAEAAERAKHAAAERAAAEAKKKAAEAAAKAAAEAKAANNPAAKVIAKSQVTVAAKAKPPSNDLMRYWKMFKKNTSVQMGILAAVLSIIMIALVVMAARS